MSTNKVAFCTVENHDQAVDIVLDLKLHGFVPEEISVLMPNSKATTAFAHEVHTKAPQGASMGAGAGGVAGGLVGLLVGVGALAIPGLGPLIAAGPLLATLSGVAFGGTVGGLAGALVGFGMTEVEAKLYERRLSEGQIIVTADCGYDDARVSKAQEIFRAKGAEDVTTLYPSAPRTTTLQDPPTPAV